DQGDGFVLRVDAQRVVNGRRQAGRFVGRVVPGEVGGGENRNERGGRERPALEPTRQRENDQRGGQERHARNNGLCGDGELVRMGRRTQRAGKYRGSYRKSDCPLRSRGGLGRSQ